MNTGVGSISVLEEVRRRLDVMNPEDYILPKNVCKTEDPPVTIATDSMKRLYTLMKLLDSEVEECRRELLASASLAQMALEGTALPEIVSGLENKDSRFSIPTESVQEAMYTLSYVKDLHTLVETMFLIEVKGAPSLGMEPVALFDDWGFRHTDPIPRRGITQLRVLLYILSPNVRREVPSDS